MTDGAAELTGSCLCGAVRYTIRPPLRPVRICHCRQCQKWSGHLVAATQVLTDHFEVSESGDLRWHRSSPQAERGFCATCGSSLFWRSDPRFTSIMAGTLDTSTGLAVEMHIFCADAPGYEIGADDAPRHPEASPSQWDPTSTA